MFQIWKKLNIGRTDLDRWTENIRKVICKELSRLSAQFLLLQVLLINLICCRALSNYCKYCS